MGGFRASDADRERYVDVIETAYVDGQLGDQDRELRVSRALTAETLDELDLLTRDLQNQPVPVVVRRTPAPQVVQPAPVAAPEPVQWPVPPRTGLFPPKAIWFVVASVFGLSLVALMSAPQEPESVFGETEVSTIDWEDRYVAPDPGFRMKVGDIREMVAAYEAELGTRQAHEVVLRPKQVVVLVPADADRQGLERWSWNGSWTRVGSTQVDGSRPLVDLGTIDAGRLVDNIRTATGALRVEDGRFSRAVLSRQGEDAVLEIFVGNTFNEVGSLITTPGGDIVRRQPFER